MTESAGYWTSNTAVPSSPFAGGTPKVGRKLSGLSLLLDEDARIRSSASISPMASQSAPSSSSKPKFSMSVDGDSKRVDTLVALPKPVADASCMEFGSFYQSYKSDDLDILPDTFHIPLAPSQPQAAPKADASLSSFSFDVHDDDKQVLTCAELIDFILRFANTNEEFVASPSSRSLWHLTTVRLVAADEKGEPLNDLPLDLSATADVLNLGLTDFAIVDRSGDRTLMHIRIEGTIHGNVPYSGNTTTVDMPYTSLNRPQGDEEDAEGDQLASQSRCLRRADRSDDSLLMISSEDSASSFDTMRRQTSIESLEPDVITVFKMDTEERISGVAPLVAHDESFEALGNIRLESPSSARGSGKPKKEKRLKRRSLVKRSDSATSNTSGAPTPSSRGRSSSGSLLISCRRWGTDRWKVAKEIALTPSGSVVWATTPASSQKKPPQLQSSRLADSDDGSARSALQMDTRSVKPFQNVRDETAPWFDDFSYSSPPAGSPMPPLPSSTSKSPFPSSSVRKPRASSSPSTAHSSASSALTTPASSGKATKAKAASNFFSSQHDEELLRKRSSIILVPAAGDPGLERRHSERPYDEDHDVIDILKYQRQTPSILSLEKTGALQTIFPHTSQPLLAKFSPKHSNSPPPTAPGAAAVAPDGSPPLSRRKLRRSRSDSQNGDAEPDDEDAESRASAANLGTIHEHQQYPHQLRERRLRAMSSLSNSSRGGGDDARGRKPPSAASLDAVGDASDDDVFEGSGRPIYAQHSSDGYDSEYDAGSQQSAAALLSAAALSAQAPAHSSAALLLSYKSAAAQSSRGSSSHRSLSPFHTSSASSQPGSDAAAEAVGAAKLQRPQHQRHHHHPHMAHRPPHTPKTLLKSAAKPPSPSPVAPTSARATTTAASAVTTHASEVASPTGEEAAATSPQKPGAQSRSALSSGVSTPTQRSSLSGLFSPSRPTEACGSAPGSRRGSSNSSFFGRLYDSLLRISSPALPPAGPASAGVAMDASDPAGDSAAADDGASARPA